MKFVVCLPFFLVDSIRDLEKDEEKLHHQDLITYMYHRDIVK